MVNPTKNSSEINALCARLRSMMDSGDAPGAVDAALNAVMDNKVSLREFYSECLVPLLAGLGRDWQAGDLAVWREHTISAICRDIIGAMAPLIKKRSGPSNGKTVVLACPPDEQHDIGLRIQADLYRLDGWNAIFLGADTPVAEIINAAKEAGAAAIVLSAATHFGIIATRTASDEISAAIPAAEIVLTGPAFKDTPIKYA